MFYWILCLFWYVNFSSYLCDGKIGNFCNVAIVEGANSIEGCCDGNGRKHKDGEADLKYYGLSFQWNVTLWWKIKDLRNNKDYQLTTRVLFMLILLSSKINFKCDV